jgi:hypothetical protein
MEEELLEPPTIHSGSWQWEEPSYKNGWNAGWRREKCTWRELQGRVEIERINHDSWAWCWGWPRRQGVWAWDWDHGLHQSRIHASASVVQAILERFRNTSILDFRDGSQDVLDVLDIFMRVLDLAILSADTDTIKALRDSCGSRRILRLWTWTDLVHDYHDMEHPSVTTRLTGVDPKEIMMLIFNQCRLREPRILEAALLAQLDFSCLTDGKANLLDIAILSAESHIVKMLINIGMTPRLLCDLDACEEIGRHFVELTDEGTLTLRMEAIKAAVEVGIDVNTISLELKLTVGAFEDQCHQCLEEDSMECLLTAATDQPGLSWMSLLDVALLGGKTANAQDLVKWGFSRTCLNAQHLLNETACVAKCVMCAAEWPVPLFAAPAQRQTAAAVALRMSLRQQLRCAWEHYAGMLLRVLHGSVRTTKYILTFVIDTPSVARLGVWHFITDWDRC